MSIPRKYRFMIGTTSRVPGSRRHYLILDYYRPVIHFQAGAITFASNFKDRWQKTDHGWHVYTPIQFQTLSEMLETAVLLGADPAWARIAGQRGYAFLADKYCISLPWPVQRMVVTYGERQEGHTRIRRKAFKPTR